MVVDCDTPVMATTLVCVCVCVFVCLCCQYINIHVVHYRCVYMGLLCGLLVCVRT